MVYRGKKVGFNVEPFVGFKVLSLKDFKNPFSEDFVCRPPTPPPLLVLYIAKCFPLALLAQHSIIIVLCLTEGEQKKTTFLGQNSELLPSCLSSFQ